ncbi:MAG TPA: GntR family transcriptional regulator [Anaerolineae bacterium]|nr:GntR family transcriptional regulator [Anaerolineae bacterium]
MYTVDRSNPTPLYEQIKTILREQITSGAFPPGTTLPTESELCTEYRVSRITIVKALTDLAHDGLIRRVQGKGSIVTPLPIRNGMDQILGFTETIRRHGLVPRSTVLSHESMEGDFELNKLFQLPVNQKTRFMEFKRLMFVDDTPAVLFTIVVREEIGAKLLEFNLENVSFYKLYQEILGRRVARNETTLTPILAPPEGIEYLHLTPNTPQFLFQGLSFLEGDMPIELSTGIFRGDLFQFSSTIYRLREEVNYKEINSSALREKTLV